MEPSYGDAGPPISRQQTPHVRLNSGVDNLLNAMHSSSSRSLTTFPPQNPSLRQSRSRPTLYTNAAGESAELLLPPRRTRARPCRDEDTPATSPVQQSPIASANSSRRSSWSTDSAGSRHSRGPFASPFDDSRAPSRSGSDEGEGINTQTVAERFNIHPNSGLLLFPEDVEKDDYMHNPDPNDKDGGECDVFSGRGLINVGGLALITLGVLILFIGYPVLSFVQLNINGPSKAACAQDPNCIRATGVPLLKNVRRGLIDPDTPKSAMTRTSLRDGSTQKLVFSDEFNVDGRTFYDGDDAYFQAMDLWYGVTMDLEWYDPDAVTTKDGTLNIRFDAFQNHNLNYRSGMIQSWNKMCFKGGYIEASVSLPGRGDTMGFWPGVWTMGNLGRPGYAATTDGMWPYSYDDVCDAGITANQSDPTGLNYLPGMRLPACSCNGEDHPTPGKSRSAPEVDALEASVGFLDPPSGAAIGSASQSYQCAPFDVWWQPDYDFVEVYDHGLTTMNSYCGGVYQQAVSGVTNLNNKWYEGGKKQFQKYGFDYAPGSTGKVTWNVGDQASWTLDARAMGPNGNIGQRVMPEEPMAVVINFGMSNGFAALNLTGLGPLMPATMRIDYLRIYQDANNPLVTCDPPGYPTTDYIKKHPEPYSNPNLTHWAQTGYEWPKNSFVHGCKANDKFKGH